MGEKEEMTYPPKNGWICPHCKKFHSKPHFAFDRQVNLLKSPGELGRVQFNREGSGMPCDDYKLDTEIDESKTGPQMIDDLHNAPLFCPHCGWQDELLYVVKIPDKWRSTK